MNGLVAQLDPWREPFGLAAADVHLAATLGRLGGESRPAVLLAAALAARAPRLGDVCADLRGLESGPPFAEWCAALATSPLVEGDDAPLVVRNAHVYLQRYHAYELAVATHLRAFAAARVATIDADLGLLDTVFDGRLSAEQRAVVAGAAHRGLTVLVGGPGTGKTTTVAALLATVARSLGSLRIALIAPTGKAAARLGEAFREAAAQLPADVATALAAVETSTIHRLLGAMGDSSSRFRHHREHPLPHDVVIVDESSMVSLPLMAHLLDAVRRDARVVLVGDPGQLASVEAGSVLADVAASAAALDGCVTELTQSRRFPPGSPVDVLAQAIGAGDTVAARTVLAAPDSPLADAGAVRWHPQAEAAVDAVRAVIEPVTVAVADAAAAGDGVAALDHLAAARVLCAHRHGSMGVERWNERVESWLAATGRAATGWYAGRPVMITANDYRLGLFNGDVGVVVHLDGRPMVAFPASGGPYLVAPSRLERFETVHAMTIHKSQGSEFDHAVVVLPPVGSRLASRELLYTAVTRARRLVTVLGSAEALDEVVARRTQRASGLAEMLRARSAD